MSFCTISLLTGVILSSSSVWPEVEGSNNEPRKEYTLANSGWSPSSDGSSIEAAESAAPTV